MIQEIPYAGWKRNLRLRGAITELVITLDVGPRIIRYAFPEGKNVFVEMAEQMGGVGETEWMIRGGHRFWTAPEGDHSYELDNGPVTWKKLSGESVEIVQPASKKFGFQNTLRVELLAGDVVKVTHLLANTADHFGIVRRRIDAWARRILRKIIPPRRVHALSWDSGKVDKHV